MKQDNTSQYRNADVDAGALGPNPEPEKLLDFAVELTFPASDPISIHDAFNAAQQRQLSDR